MITACALVFCMPGLSSAGANKELKDFAAFSFLDNQEINTAEMRGTILVMEFGSIYCKPCVELLPVMNELHERYQDSDVRILLLDIDMAVDPALQREFVQRHAITSPYIINALSIARDNKVYMLPTSLIVDREGTIVTRLYGFRKIGKFDKVIKKLRPIIKGPKDPESIETTNSTHSMETVGDTGGTNNGDTSDHPDPHH